MLKSTLLFMQTIPYIGMMEFERNLFYLQHSPTRLLLQIPCMVYASAWFFRLLDFHDIIHIQIEDISNLDYKKKPLHIDRCRSV